MLLGAGNAAGGYAVTDRMLAMFQPSAQAARGAKGAKSATVKRLHAKNG